MNARQQTDAFVTALLKHCIEAEVQSIRNIGTPDEEPASVHPLRDLADLERLRGWLWHENASRAGQILIRPAVRAAHPWLFLDDVPRSQAERIAGKYAALVVETTPGNCQIRLLAADVLVESERTEIQRDLAARVGGDAGSIAGSKWGRLPGYRNRKPGRDCWTNFLLDTTNTAPRLAVVPPRQPEAAQPGGRGLHPSRTPAADGGGYAAEFAFACHRLRDGLDCGEVIRLVADNAMRRGKRSSAAQARKYAERTVAAALRSLR